MPDDYQFGGFTRPQYTQTPDQLFDELLAPGLLTEAELRVLLYIVRRTFGFKKDSDTISLSQLSEGITRKDGTRLDYGAGVQRKAIVGAIKRLEAKGIIRAERGPIQQRGQANETTTYTLVMAHDNPSGPKTLAQFPKDTSPRVVDVPTLVSQRHPQETASRNIEQESTPTPIDPTKMTPEERADWVERTAPLRGRRR